MPAAAGPSEPQTELKTFLIADVRGYTRFTQEQGDEVAARLATKFAAVARQAVGERGGRVIELRGDEALAVFSSPRQALRAAIELQSQFAEQTAIDPSLPLRVGIGLDAGEVVLVENGYRGGALNLAARLSSLAGPGEVLASEGAVHLARRITGLAYVERGLVELKGFADRVRVIRVLPESDAAAEQTGPPTDKHESAAYHQNGETPDDAALPIGGFLGALPEGLLVARDEEFDRILNAITAVEAGSGRLVLLAGEPGVGKTRLAQEVTLKARNHSFVMASGRCYEPESTVPFYPFLEALATLHAVAPPHIRDDVPRRWPDIERLLPNQTAAQATALTEGQEEQQRLFWAVTGYLQAIAAKRPVALLLDDLHWADASSLELLQHLARHTRANRVLLLGAYRDVEVNRRHPLEAALRDLGRERLIEEIQIRRLDEKGTGELVSATLGDGDVAPEFVHLVHLQTEGNPFFVEEVVRTLVERGDVYRLDGRWEGRSVEDIEVPKSVRSVVGQRLSHLSLESQEILQEASVLGPAFSFDDLIGMCNRSETEVERALEEAMGAGLVRETGVDTYAFNHALTQGTLYAELPSRKRRRLHLAAGQSLERLPEGSRKHRVAELAWHFLEGDDPARALPYALRAARYARQVFAYDEAARHYRTALELARELGDVESETKSLEGLGSVLRTVARYDEAIEVLSAALAHHRAAGNVAGERWTTAHIGRVHALRGTPSEGIDVVLALVKHIEAHKCEDEVERLGESSAAGLAALYAALANLYQETDQSARQLEAAEKALEVARQAEGSRAGARIQAEGQMWRASAMAEMGDLDDARRMLEDVIPLAQEAGDPLVLSRAHNSLAMVYSEAGQYTKERMHIEKALETAERMGDPTRIAFMNHRLGWHLMVLGSLQIAREHLERALSIVRALGTTPTTAWTLLGLAQLALLQGRTEEGERYLAEGMAIARRPPYEPHAVALGRWMTLDRFVREGNAQAAGENIEKDPNWPPEEDWTSVLLLPVRAWERLAAQDTDAAQDLALDAIDKSNAERNRTMAAEALRMYGIVLSAQGWWEESTQTFEQALSMARTIHQPYAEARTLHAYALSYLQRGESPRAEGLLQQALRIYRRLGAVPDTRRAESVLNALMAGEQLTTAR
jgi:class 3 adenylate cyclase/tetratricopeptide (TPR) repeat protein